MKRLSIYAPKSHQHQILFGIYFTNLSNKHIVSRDGQTSNRLLGCTKLLVQWSCTWEDCCLMINGSDNILQQVTRTTDHASHEESIFDMHINRPVIWPSVIEVMHLLIISQLIHRVIWYFVVGHSLLIIRNDFNWSAKMSMAHHPWYGDLLVALLQ